MVDIAAVPDRLKDQVAEAEDQDVAHRLLAEVVVDAIDLRLAEHLANLAVELYRRLKVTAERLLNNDATPATIGLLVIEPRSPKTSHDLWER